MNKKKLYRKKYNIQKIFVINLNRRKDRLKHFKSRYNFDIKLNRIEAVDGRDLNIDELFKNNTIGEYGYNSLKKYRNFHHELTHNGSVGCYLSHYNIWKSIYDKDKNRNYIIFEDDTILNDMTLDDISKRIKKLPDDWDIYLLSSPHFVYEKEFIGKNLYKGKRFFLMNAYVINKKGIEKIFNTNTIFPINQQIDSYLSELATDRNLNIYVHDESFPYLEQSQQFNTDIQESTIHNLTYDRYTL